MVASLKNYKGDLRDLLIENTPTAVLDTTGLTRTYILDGVDEVPPRHREALRLQLHDLLTTDVTAKIVLTARQAFHAQHPEAFLDGLTAYHLLDFDDNETLAPTAW